MSMPGWYPDPAGGQGRFRYWDGSAWSNQTTVNPSDPPPGTGTSGSGGGRFSGHKRTLFIIAMIVLATAVVVAWAALGNRRVGPDAPEDTNSSTPTVSGWDETSSPTPPPTVAASTIACPITANTDKTKQLNDGRLRGGGISVEQIPSWSDYTMYLQWVSDLHTQEDWVRPGWMSNIAVGQLNYEDGFDAPEIAARQSMECYASSGYYINFTERIDLVNEATTIDGYPAWHIRSEVRIASPDMPEIEGDLVDIYVVDFGEANRMGIFFSSVTIGDTARQELVDESIASLRVG
ncbi:MAG: DUF2510 domain-containing protein [Propionibacterium sp.]|nr:DUF2510 domain-containing protein [Propionibacterium sp.]